MSKSQSRCLICGAESLVTHLTCHDDLQCFLCYRIVLSSAKCREGHFVCDRCHSLSGNDFVEGVCVNRPSKDPTELVRAPDE
jgi:hypothetical protein